MDKVHLSGAPQCRFKDCAWNTIFRTFMPLENDLRYQLETLLRESCQFNANDVLVHMNLDSNKLLVTQGDSLCFTDFPTLILREAQRTYNESGVSSLCLVKGKIQLPLGGRKMESPLWLVPLSYNFNKIKQEHTFEEDEDYTFLNPYVQHQLELLDVDPAGHVAEELIQLLQIKEIECDLEFRCIGNFHHHRYQVIRELEELLSGIELAPHLREIFGFHNEAQTAQLPFDKGQLFPSDLDHEDVFESITCQDTVVQGPPGTGKSQVLTNCVAKSLGSGLTNIIVSEKRAALEVIRKKLGVFGLDKLCFIVTNDQLSRQFLLELKETWDYFETLETRKILNLHLSEQYLDSLQMTLDLLNQKELIGGLSFHEFIDEVGDLHIEKYNYHSDAISLRFLKDEKERLETIYRKNLASSLGYLRKDTLSSEQLISLDQQLRNWLQTIESLSSIVTLNSFEELSIAMRKAALCQIYENDFVKRYAPLFELNSKAQKKFLKLRVKYMHLQEQLSQLKTETGTWKSVPTQAECKVLSNQLETGSFFERRKARRRWKMLSDLPTEAALSSLNAQSTIHAVHHDISKIKIEFCDLGMDNPETEMQMIFTGIHAYTESQWQELINLSAAEKSQLTGQHEILQSLYAGIRSTLSLEPHTSISESIELLLEHLPGILSERELIDGLASEVLRALGRNKSFESLRGEALRSHQVQFFERFPAFSGFQPEELHTKIQAVISAEEEEFGLYAQEIEQVCKTKFDRYHQLLVTPARNLSDSEKELKVRLRRGKSILVKEFGKTRQHPTLRELYHSDARLWIEVLKPVWLSNPVQLAKCFPMEGGLFYLAIFDEASQMPLQNALGALQRSKRALIAGDEHQMGPSSFFRAGGGDVIDLLHQANYHWNRVSLKHHYRSSHPDLIRFSNKHFYREELQSYPSAGAQHPINWHFIENGRFVERRNVVEAQCVAKKIIELFAKYEQLGIVAFSEEQLGAIRDSLPENIVQRITSLEYPGFFKTLENVQGDECDQLVVSFGYGYNEDNEFHLRFGPMNTANGRKRLNVLLTRARQSIHFFSSVSSSDFSLSDNESVNLLKNWLYFAEHYHQQGEQLFPHRIDPIVNGNEITLPRIQEKLPFAREVATLQRVLENRGWKVRYC